MRVAVVVLGLVACSGSPFQGSPDAGSGSGDATADAPGTPGTTFPLHVSSDHGFLVTSDGRPFLLHGEAAWSLIAQVDTTAADQYLTDRRQRGVSAVIVNLIEHKFADQAPNNAAGDAPFTVAGDFSTPNEAYFAHADQVIDRAASHDMAVMLFPSYLGFDGLDEGWFQEMSALSTTKCRSYGDFVGARYANRTNIIWMWGGDYTPPSGSAGEACMLAIAAGIRAAAPGALASAHWAPESTSRDEPAFASQIDLVGVYTYATDLPRCRSARAATPRRPTFLLETTYENEHNATTADVRQQQWWGLIGCGAGEFSGNNPIWLFGAGWPQQLDSPVSRDQARLAAIATVRWQDLAPDDALVTAGAGTGSSQVAAARTADGAQALVYVPPAGASTITVDLGKLSGPVTATWQDPTTSASTPAGSGLTGSHAFAVPGANASGDHDWVLVLVAS